MANRIVLSGRLTADPELRNTTDGTPVTSFAIAVPRKYKKDMTDFLDVVAWRKDAEFVCRYFTKGKWIEVDGSIQTRTYTDKNGNNRKAVEIVADNVSFVGDKPKEDGAPANSSVPPPANFDPFANAAPPTRFHSGQMAPAHASGNVKDFAELDEDGDLPF